jgi:hypothetical protein
MMPHTMPEELDTKQSTQSVSSDFLAVALFSGIGLVVSLIAVFYREQGS